MHDLPGLRFPLPEEIAMLRDTVRDFGAYPFSLPLVRHFDRLELDPHMTIFVGENGSGKSTLLEAMAVALGMNAEGGGDRKSTRLNSSHT